jgi:hypothetical protein
MVIPVFPHAEKQSDNPNIIMKEYFHSDQL